MAEPEPPSPTDFNDVLTHLRAVLDQDKEQRLAQLRDATVERVQRIYPGEKFDAEILDRAADNPILTTDGPAFGTVADDITDYRAKREIERRSPKPREWYNERATGVPAARGTTARRVSHEVLASFLQAHTELLLRRGENCKTACAILKEKYNLQQSDSTLRSWLREAKRTNP